MMKRPKIPVHLPHILQPEKDSMVDFVTHFRDIPDSYEAKLQSSKNGLHKTEPFEDAGLHDFRQVSLEEFSRISCHFIRSNIVGSSRLDNYNN